MHHDIQLFAEYAVTPFVGVWIETSAKVGTAIADIVTPFVGVWIETKQTDKAGHNKDESHPSWVCGLKHTKPRSRGRAVCVTPFVGVWIETQNSKGG